MTKFKKMMSVTLAGCMAASALMMSAGAVNTNASADTSASVVSNANWGSPDSLIDSHGVNWAKIDTSMCVPGKDYHFYPQSVVNDDISLTASARSYYSGWVYGIPKNKNVAPSTFSLPNYKDLAFETGETGTITVSATETTSSISTVNISVYDITRSSISDWVTLTIGGKSKSFNVDPTHEYRFYLSNNSVNSANVRFQITVK